jgi:hypothetical protein
VKRAVAAAATAALLVPVELILHGHDLAGRKGGAREATLLRAGNVEA